MPLAFAWGAVLTYVSPPAGTPLPRAGDEGWLPPSQDVRSRMHPRTVALPGLERSILMWVASASWRGFLFRRARWAASDGGDARSASRRRQVPHLSAARWP